LYFLYPYLYVIGFALVGLFAARGAVAMMPLPTLYSLASEGLLALIFFALLMRVQGEKRRVQHALDNCIFANEFLDGRRNDIEERIRAFAERLVQTAREGSAHEVLVVGHSLGATLAVQVLTKALAIDPALARRTTSISLLTAGSTLPKFTLDPRGRAVRDDVATLARNKDLTWVDVQASLDYMSFYGTDPFGAKLERPHTTNPRIVEAVISEMIDIRTLWRRPLQTIWNYSQRLMRLHYQTVLANKRRSAYDYYAIVCGPLPLRSTVSDPVTSSELLATART
jgi:pimeloyl-ACP methyl ester carboxylesterase